VQCRRLQLLLLLVVLVPMMMLRGVDDSAEMR